MTFIREEISFSIKKAIAAGHLRPGDKLPSVRAMSREMAVNSNTVHHAIGTLVSEGLLVTIGAVGIFVSGSNQLRGEAQTDAVRRSVEILIVDAKNFGFNERDFQKLISERWKGLAGGRPRANLQKHRAHDLLKSLPRSRPARPVQTQISHD